jgi:hypothetical protein
MIIEDGGDVYELTEAWFAIDQALGGQALKLTKELLSKRMSEGQTASFLRRRDLRGDAYKIMLNIRPIAIDDIARKCTLCSKTNNRQRKEKTK